MNFEKEVKFLQLQVSDILRKIKAKSTSWGQLFGDIRNQKDLIRYFGLKQDLLKSGASVISTNVPMGSITTELQESQLQSVETAHEYAKLVLENQGFDVTLDL